MANIEPRTGKERLAENIVVRKKDDDETLVQHLKDLDPSLVEAMDGSATLYDHWQKHKLTEQDLADGIGKLQKTRQATLADHQVLLQATIDRLREMERRGLVEIDYPARVRGGDATEVLRSLSVADGHLVFVHSSLSRLGYVEISIEELIHDLRGAVGESGTLAMPVFSENYPEMSTEPYDKAKSPSTAGIVGEVFRKMPGVLRSDNPCHSVAAIGPLAEEFTAPTGNWEMFDRKGPFGKLYDWNGWIIMLGCSLEANTMLHAIEAWALPYLPPMYLNVSDGKGGLKRVVCRRFPNWCREWYGKDEEGKIQKRLYERGLISEQVLGAGKVYAMKAKDLVDQCLQVLKKEPGILLCERDNCCTCVGCRAMLEDWVVPDTV